MLDLPTLSAPRVDEPLESWQCHSARYGIEQAQGLYGPKGNHLSKYTADLDKAIADRYLLPAVRAQACSFDPAERNEVSCNGSLRISACAPCPHETLGFPSTNLVCDLSSGEIKEDDCVTCVSCHAQQAVDQSKNPDQRPVFVMVEVAGIGPASFSLLPSILRAQSVIFLGHRLVIDAGRRLKPTKFPLSPAGAATR